MPQIRVFIDSDVVISSLLSKSGVSSLLFRQNYKDVKFAISSISLKELMLVTKRLGIANNKLDFLVKNKLEIVKLNETIKKIIISYKNYVSDINDTHIIAGAQKAQARFLITYNLRHFKVEKIMRDLHIYIMTPGTFLQYLRSLK